MSKENQNMAIDINADVGEGFNNEAVLMPYLSSCNIACGGHAGNKSLMTSVIKMAKDYQVKVGAHPSFPDKANFGRLAMAISKKDLLTSLIAQVNDLVELLTANNESLHHIKPHGALYNLANSEKTYAEVVISLMKHFGESVKLYAPYGSVVSKIAERNNIIVVYEVFADRNYNDDLTLVPRTHPDALIENSTELAVHVLHMLEHHKVRTINGNKKDIKANTVCIHGDHPQAELHLRTLTAELNKIGILIQ